MFRWSCSLKTGWVCSLKQQVCSSINFIWLHCRFCHFHRFVLLSHRKRRFEKWWTKWWTKWRTKWWTKWCATRGAFSPGSSSMIRSRRIELEAIRTSFWFACFRLLNCLFILIHMRENKASWIVNWTAQCKVAAILRFTFCFFGAFALRFVPACSSALRL